MWIKVTLGTSTKALYQVLGTWIFREKRTNSVVDMSLQMLGINMANWWRQITRQCHETANATQECRIDLGQHQLRQAIRRSPRTNGGIQMEQKGQWVGRALLTGTPWRVTARSIVPWPSSDPGRPGGRRGARAREEVVGRGGWGTHRCRSLHLPRRDLRFRGLLCSWSSSSQPPLPTPPTPNPLS
jgi:hypothetical protein